MSKRKKKQQPQKDEQGNVVSPPGNSKEPEQGSKKMRIHISSVHEEYLQTKYVNDVDEEKIRSKCKHCAKVFDHKLCSELKRHLKSCHPEISKKVELLD